MAELIITIDGPAASGKSTAARLLAERLGASFLDTGAMYRAVTLAAMQAGVDMNNEDELLGILEGRRFEFAARQGKMTVSIDGLDVTEQIRRPDVTANSRYVASSEKIREKLVRMQRQFADNDVKIVTEGRDQGTVAFPDADVKFYLKADAAERAKRRLAELQNKGENGNIEKIQMAIEERDRSDQNRAVGPLKPAGDAIIVDTTNLSIEEVVEKLSDYVRLRLGVSFTFLASLVPSPRRVKKTSPGPAKMRWYHFARNLCKIFCKVFFRMRIYGLENVPAGGAVVLISNHQSFLDPLFCGIYLKINLYFLARDTLFKHRFFGSLISSVNSIPVRRGQADLSAMKKIIAILREGSGVCLFPEATRTQDGRIAPFKPGFGLLCRRGGASVVPVLVDGAFECWPRHKKIFSPGSRIVVCYGKCITAGEVKNMNDRELAERLTDTLRQMQRDCRIKHGKEPYDYNCRQFVDK